MLRAGFVRPLAAGLLSYLPLAKRSLDKLCRILREELGACGGQEVSMPVVHPAETWDGQPLGGAIPQAIHGPGGTAATRRGG